MPELVSAFYDRFPYPGDPLQDGPPPGYNWRWCVDAAYAACTGAVPPRSASGSPFRVLDAGCGTGVSTDYLAHLNPGAEILAVDISPGTLEVARERARRSGAASQASSLRFDPTLVRGMGYYTGTIFEIEHPGSGSSIGGGGRYDGMVGKWWGTDAPAVGISLGIERNVDLIPDSQSDSD